MSRFDWETRNHARPSAKRLRTEFWAQKAAAALESDDPSWVTRFNEVSREMRAARAQA